MRTALGLLLAILGAMGAIAAEWPQPWPQPWPQSQAEPEVQPQPEQERQAPPQSLSASARSYNLAHGQFSAGRPLVVVLTAKWCGPCQLLKPHYGKLARLGAVAVIDVDEEPALARSQLVWPADKPYPIPTVVYYSPNGRNRIYQPEQLDWLLATIR